MRVPALRFRVLPMLGACLPLALALACSSDPKPLDSSSGGGDDTSPQDGGGAQVGPTWYQDVQPIIAEHCWTCHDGENDLAFDLTDPKMVASMAEWLLVKMEGDDSPPYKMPPYSVATDACDAGTGFAWDERVSEAELAVYKEWIAAGTPLGDPATPTEYLVQHRELTGARIEDMSAMDFTTSDGQVGDAYQCWSWNLDLKDDAWVTGIRVNPDNRNILHHAVIMADYSGLTAPKPEDDPDGDGTGKCASRDDSSVYPDATMLATWVPGADPVILPEGTAMHFPPGTRLVSSTHYHANGTGQHDGTTLSLAWADKPPEYEMVTLPLGAGGPADVNSTHLVDPPFEIPPGATNHLETWVERYSNDRQEGPFKVWGVFPHAHYAATAMNFAVERIDDKGVSQGEQCLIDVPVFDFAWQRTYEFAGDFDQLPEVWPGDNWVIRCTYDNSPSNPVITAAMKTEGIEDYRSISVGNGSFDEMCIMHAILMIPYDGRFD